ncbi:hypothetical protein BDV96DRAFT_689805 [Lophiotrema nucula]|uniref:Uncharacterized protein n=1 Tax=Lophiotrema nucula TaxID=690887 RepID=A0A6A5YZI7_9PLEO|nr:hypothetical protein BDV96DRAFT_689805 [Lophiotrema nucula]
MSGQDSTAMIQISRAELKEVLREVVKEQLTIHLQRSPQVEAAVSAATQTPQDWIDRPEPSAATSDNKSQQCSALSTSSQTQDAGVAWAKFNNIVHTSKFRDPSNSYSDEDVVDKGVTNDPQDDSSWILSPASGVSGRSARSTLSLNDQDINSQLDETPFFYSFPKASRILNLQVEFSKLSLREDDVQYDAGTDLAQNSTFTVPQQMESSENPSNTWHSILEATSTPDIGTDSAEVTSLSYFASPDAGIEKDYDEEDGDNNSMAMGMTSKPEAASSGDEANPVTPPSPVSNTDECKMPVVRHDESILVFSENVVRAASGSAPVVPPNEESDEDLFEDVPGCQRDDIGPQPTYSGMNADTDLTTLPHDQSGTSAATEARQPQHYEGARVASEPNSHADGLDDGMAGYDADQLGVRVEVSGFETSTAGVVEEDSQDTAPATIGDFAALNEDTTASIAAPAAEFDENTTMSEAFPSVGIPTMEMPKHKTRDNIGADIEMDEEIVTPSLSPTIEMPQHRIGDDIRGDIEMSEESSTLNFVSATPTSRTAPQNWSPPTEMPKNRIVDETEADIEMGGETSTPALSNAVPSSSTALSAWNPEQVLASVENVVSTSKLRASFRPELSDDLAYLKDAPVGTARPSTHAKPMMKIIMSTSSTEIPSESSHQFLDLKRTDGPSIGWHKPAKKDRPSELLKKDREQALGIDPVWAEMPNSHDADDMEDISGDTIHEEDKVETSGPDNPWRDLLRPVQSDVSSRPASNDSSSATVVPAPAQPTQQAAPTGSNYNGAHGISSSPPANYASTNGPQTSFSTPAAPSTVVQAPSALQPQVARQVLAPRIRRPVPGVTLPPPDSPGSIAGPNTTVQAPRQRPEASAEQLGLHEAYQRILDMIATNDDNCRDMGRSVSTLAVFYVDDYFPIFDHLMNRYKFVDATERELEACLKDPRGHRWQQHVYWMHGMKAQRSLKPPDADVADIPFSMRPMPQNRQQFLERVWGATMNANFDLVQKGMDSLSFDDMLRWTTEQESKALRCAVNNEKKKFESGPYSYRLRHILENSKQSLVQEFKAMVDEASGGSQNAGAPRRRSAEDDADTPKAKMSRPSDENSMEQDP